MLPTCDLGIPLQLTQRPCYQRVTWAFHYNLYHDHVTNKEVCAKIQQAIGPHEDLLTIVKRRSLKWYGHVSRSSGLAKTVLQGTVEGGRRLGGQQEEVGKQHQEMHRPGVCQVPEGSGEQGKIEETWL